MSYLGFLGQEQPKKDVSPLSALLSPFTGMLTSEASKIADPIVAKIQPMIREELDRQVPTFSIYAGLAMGALVLMGIWTGILTTKKRFGK
jgi:type VI protein secretion system component VasF